MLQDDQKGQPELVQRMEKWLSCTWDPAHRIELALNQVRRDKAPISSESVDVERLDRASVQD
eukprot:scaffold447523_cov24-Prasinocladus_malaysianus.AAC.1